MTRSSIRYGTPTARANTSLTTTCPRFLLLLGMKALVEPLIADSIPCRRRSDEVSDVSDVSRPSSPVASTPRARSRLDESQSSYLSQSHSSGAPFLTIPNVSRRNPRVLKRQTNSIDVLQPMGMTSTITDVRCRTTTRKLKILRSNPPLPTRPTQLQITHHLSPFRCVC